ncbi:integrase [Halomonas sp. LBP4]|nr:integrase [Halomonas sp. LBP4]
MTHIDIKKYFCFIRFHEHLVGCGDISQEEFEKSVKNKKAMWESSILPKYDKDVIEIIATDAVKKPIPVWDISLYEIEKNGK